MRKLGFLVFTVLILAGFAVWNADTNQARVIAPTNSAQIDVSQITSVAEKLPTERFVDYSLVYEGE